MDIPEYMGLYSTKTDIDGLERNKGELNTYKYTKQQILQRGIAIKAMHRDYPNVPLKTCEILYDVITNMPEDEVNDIINKGLWEAPSKYDRPKGGTIKSGMVYESDGTTLVQNNLLE